MTIKQLSISKAISFLLATIILVGIIPFNVMAVRSNSNDIVVPVDEWEYIPSNEVPSMFLQETPMLFSSKNADESLSASDMVNVHVTAVNKTTGLKENVADATVRLFVGSEEKSTAITDLNGVATISLAGLTLEEKYKATISADKIVSRGKAIDGTARDDLYNKYYPKEEGEYYRYTMELHSEWIDRNGNWNGTSLPKTASSNKVDMVFAIDTTGSMWDEINNVKNNIADFAQALINEGLDIRFCIIEYLDITTNEPTYVHTVNGSRWYDDVESVISVLEDITLGDGGDWAETPIDALGEIADIDAMNYRSDAHKFAFVLTDADYKNNNNYGYADMDDITRTLAGLNIVTSVITDSYCKLTYRTLYNGTNGIYANIYASDFNAEMLTLSDNIVEAVTRQVNLTLSEPRMLVNLSVCYFANDKTSQSSSYKDSVKNMLNEYSHRIAETSDGHVLIDKVLLFHTDNRLNFYNTSHYASMVDIRIETEVDDDGTWWNNVQIHSNAHVTGFYLDDQYTATYDDNSTEHFSNLKNGEELNGRQSFVRIQMSGKEGAGWNNSLIDDAYAYSTTVAHETGHYLFGFFDEYLNADGTSWRDVGGKPYTAYGLMDNQHTDIEMSKTAIDYSYMNGDFANATKSVHTNQSWFYTESCEDWLADLLTNEARINEKWGRTTASADLDYWLTGDYQATYTKTVGDHDRTATYSYAGLTDSDYMNNTFITGGGGAWSLHRDIPSTVAADYFESLESTATSLGNVVMEGNGSTVSFTVTPVDGYIYTIFHRESGDEGYNTIETAESGGVYIAELPVDIGELAEIRLVAEKDGTSSYNTYYVDRSELTDVGYLYTSANNTVLAYVKADEESSYSFVADNTSYINGDYVSVNQATIISSDNDVTVDSGEIYSVVSYMAEIDYTTLSWFQYKNSIWKQIATDYSEEENMNIGARADLDGEGLYVLMAKKAPVDDTVFATENLSFTQVSDRDAVVTLSFDDKNADSKYYNVYYSESEFTDKNADNVVVRSYNADSTDLILNLIERGRVVYAAVEIVLEDGTRSPLSALIRLEAGEADSDGDGIPDWYCDKYRLWGKDGEEKDIANSDDDGDGLTNLEEYRGGCDPTNPNDPVHTTNIPVTGVSVSISNVVLIASMSQSVTATVFPANATNQSVIWSVDDPNVATISVTDNVCTITGIAIGTTQVYVVTADGGYSMTIYVEVAETIVHNHSNVDGILECNSDNHWKVCDDCGEPYDISDHSFDNACDKTCNNVGCDYTRDTSHTPNADDSDCTTAINCSVCGEEMTAAKNHAFDNACDINCNNSGCNHTRITDHVPNADDGDCTTPIVCSICGEITIAAKNHDFDNGCDTNCNNQSCTYVRSASHIPNEDDGNCRTEITCSICGEVTTPAKSHTFDNACDTDCNNADCNHTRTIVHTPNADDGDCTTAITCSVCGEVTTTAKSHAFDNACDTDCNNADCNHTRTIVHTPNADDGDCTTAITCSVCGEVTTVAKSHTFDNDCDIDCNNCKQTRTIEHTYDDKYDKECNVCNTERDTPISPVITITIIGSVLVLSGGAFAIYWSIKKKSRG